MMPSPQKQSYENLKPCTQHLTLYVPCILLVCLHTCTWQLIKGLLNESQVANDVEMKGHDLTCDSLLWGCINPRCQVTMVTVTHNIFGSSEWNLLHDTMLAPRILRCLLDFWKICGPLLFQQIPEKKD
jgi:hypothetical protein